mmetsp:Transcript_40699/g.91496  ORF Transcript_40699/g.91496 Transcript_40699/m.91496 type:complete len:275 (-) Transcript_40699:2295-3119(-)
MADLPQEGRPVWNSAHRRHHQAQPIHGRRDLHREENAHRGEVSVSRVLHDPPGRAAHDRPHQLRLGVPPARGPAGDPRLPGGARQIADAQLGRGRRRRPCPRTQVRECDEGVQREHAQRVDPGHRPRDDGRRKRGHRQKVCASLGGGASAVGRLFRRGPGAGGGQGGRQVHPRSGLPPLQRRRDRARHPAPGHRARRLALRQPHFGLWRQIRVRPGKPQVLYGRVRRARVRVFEELRVERHHVRAGWAADGDGRRPGGAEQPREAVPLQGGHGG